MGSFQLILVDCIMITLRSSETTAPTSPHPMVKRAIAANSVQGELRYSSARADRWDKCMCNARLNYPVDQNSLSLQKLAMNVCRHWRTCFLHWQRNIIAPFCSSIRTLQKNHFMIL